MAIHLRVAWMNYHDASRSDQVVASFRCSAVVGLEEENSAIASPVTRVLLEGGHVIKVNARLVDIRDAIQTALEQAG